MHKLAIPFALAAITTVSYAQPLEYFIKIAHKSSPVLGAASHRSQAAGSTYKAESIFIKNPMLSVGHSNSPTSSWPSLKNHAMSGLQIGVSQTIAFPWEDYQRKSALEEKYLSSKQQVVETKNQISLQVKQIYHRLYFLLRKKQILEENKQSLSDIVKVARALVTVNKMSSAQLLKLEANLVLIGNQILEVEAGIVKEKAKMEKVCGAKLEWRLDDVSSWMTSSATIKPVSDFDASHHPLLRRIRFQLRAEKAMASQERSKLFPNVTFSGSYRFREAIAGKDTGEDFISLSASMPLPLYYPIKERHKISAQDAKVSAVKEEMRDVKLMLEKSWLGQSLSVDSLLKAYANYESEVKPKYFASYKAQLGSLASGTVSLLDVLDAYRDYLDVSIREAKLYADLQQGLATLEYLALPGQTISGEKK